MCIGGRLGVGWLYIPKLVDPGIILYDVTFVGKRRFIVNSQFQDYAYFFGRFVLDSKGQKCIA